jgi:hypothetical protein
VSLALSYDAAFMLDGLAVAAAGKQRLQEVTPRIRVLLPRSTAGRSLTISLLGYRGGQAWAGGQVDVTPIEDREVDGGTVTLQRLPCGVPPGPECELCGGMVCNTPPGDCYAAQGTCIDGRCSYAPDDSASCSDGDDCTTDHCVAGACLGLPATAACTTPPGPRCADSATLHTFTAPGLCSNRACTYPSFTERTCPGGCIEGICMSSTSGCTPGRWTISVVDATGDVGQRSALALDVQGGVHIAYHDRSAGALKYAYKASAAWTRATIEAAEHTGGDSPLAVDGQGVVHLAYEQGSRLRYGRLPVGGSAWQIETPVPVGYASMALALEDGGAVDIAYLGQNTGGGYPVEHARRAVGAPSFTTQLVEADARGGGFYGIALSLEADGAGDLHLGYHDEATGVRYARTAGGSWQAPELVHALSAEFTSLGLSRSSGTVHIAYRDIRDHRLRHASKAPGGEWRLEVADDVEYGGEFASLAVDAAGGAHVSHYNSTQQDLRYSYRPAGGTWTTTVVDSAGDVGGHTSLAVDAAGAVHVSYYDATNRELKYARRCP